MKASKYLSPCRQKGIASIELAIILPIMVFLWAGTIEAGMAFSRYNNLTKAVRDGARYISDKALIGTANTFNSACLGTADNNSCAAAGIARRLIEYNHISSTSNSILPGTLDSVDIQTVGVINISVTAIYTHNLISGNLVNSFFGTSFPVSRICYRNRWSG